MSNAHSYEDCYDKACEYVIPVKLIVPIFVEPKVYVQSVCAREKVRVYLEPELHLEPEVRADHAKCAPQNGYKHEVVALTQEME